MAKEKTKVTIDYNNLGEITLSENTLRDTYAMNDLADNLNQSMRAAFGNIPKDKNPYEDIYVNGENVVEAVAKSIDLDYVGPTARNRLCALYVTRAHLYGDTVQAKDPLTQEMLDVESTGQLPSTVEKETLSFLDKILMFFGIGKRKNEIAQNAEMVQIGQDYVFDAVEDSIKDDIDKNKENMKFFKEFANYKQKSLDKHFEMVDMHFVGMEDRIKNSPCMGAILEGDTPRLAKFSAKHNYIPRSNDTILACMMLNNGYTLKQISDPNFTEGRTKVGEEFLQMVEDIHNKDEKISLPAQKKLAEVYLEGAKNLLKQDMPDKEILNDFIHSPQPIHELLIHRLGHDLFQEFDRGISKDIILSDPKNEILRDKMTSLSGTGNFYTLGKLCAASWLNFDHVVDNNAIPIIEGFRNVSNTVTKYEGKTIDDFICANQMENVPIMESLVRYSGALNARLYSEGEDRIDTHELLAGNINLYSKIKDDADFYVDYESFKKKQITDGGSFADREAKVKLAFKTTDMFLMDDLSNDENRILQEKKNEIANEIMKSSTFKSFAQDKTAEQLNQTSSYQDYFQKVVTEFASKSAQPKPKLKEQTPSANVNHDKQKDNGMVK